jgi:DNA repair protein RadC
MAHNRWNDTAPTAGPTDLCSRYRQEQQLAALLVRLGDLDGQRSAARCLAEFGSLSAVLAASQADLCGRARLPPMLAEAIELLACLYREASLETLASRERLDSLAALRLYALKRLRGRQTEQLVTLLLDNRNGLIREYVVADGSIRRIAVRPSELMRAALLYNASAVILLHNHPSGDPTPSPEDIAFTQELATALALLDIALHDHLIVGHNETVSFRALGAI